MRVELLEATRFKLEQSKDSLTSFRDIVGIGSERIGKTLENTVKKGIRVGASALFFVSTLFTPLDVPIKTVKAESNQNQPTSLVLLHGDGARNKMNLLFLDWNGTSLEELQKVAEETFIIPPTDTFKDGVNIYYKHPVENLNCNQQAECDPTAVTTEIDKVTNSGLPIHLSLVVIRSSDLSGNGRANIALHDRLPNNHNFAAIVRPSNFPNEARTFIAATEAHELWGHAFSGFHHEGGDVMERKTNDFNPQHTQYLRAVMNLPLTRFDRTKNQLTVQAASLGLEATIVVPYHATQVRHLITPFNNDGSGADLIVDPSPTFEIPSPPIWYGLLPDMTYSWQMCSSGISVPLLKDDQNWTQVEGWPGVWFPNPCAEQKFKTPKRFSDGIIAVSPRNNELVAARRVRLQWDNKDKDVFYYEIQSSRDCTFDIDPQTATAPVWHNLIHGGLTNPLNSWQTPELELGEEYCWRGRPRIQGDGTPVEWSPTFRFSTPAGLKSVQSDIDYGNGMIGPSAGDLARWGKPNEAVLPREEQLAHAG